MSGHVPALDIQVLEKKKIAKILPDPGIGVVEARGEGGRAR
jgi:hypothetical protein